MRLFRTDIIIPRFVARIQAGSYNELNQKSGPLIKNATGSGRRVMQINDPISLARVSERGKNRRERGRRGRTAACGEMRIPRVSPTNNRYFFSFNCLTNSGTIGFNINVKFGTARYIYINGTSLV